MNPDNHREPPFFCIKSLTVPLTFSRPLPVLNLGTQYCFEQVQRLKDDARPQKDFIRTVTLSVSDGLTHCLSLLRMPYPLECFFSYISDRIKGFTETDISICVYDST